MFELLTGIIPTITGGLFGVFQKRQEIKQKVQLRKLENEQYALELQVGLEKVNIQKEMAEGMNDFALQKLSSAEFVGSINHDQSITNTSRWVANLRALTRPIITYALIISVCVMSFMGQIDMSSPLVVLANTAVGWWFGSRVKVAK